MASPTAADDLTASVTKLSLKTAPINTTLRLKSEKTKKNAVPVADSWEDEADSDEGSDTETEDTPLGNSQAGTNAPPPTPMSPVGQKPFSTSALASPTTYGLPPFDGPGVASQSSAAPAKRPEKTDAVARRMIAAGLGLKVPRATEEQRAYDRAVREKERKRREEEKELAKKKEEEAAKAKQSVWDD